MVIVYNSIYGLQSFDNGCLREAVRTAYHFQRLAYRQGIVTNTVIFTGMENYHFGLRSDAYTTNIHSKNISECLSNVLTRRSCLTTAQAVTLGAGINSGLVNPWEIRNLGRKALNELHNFSRLRVCDITISH